MTRDNLPKDNLQAILLGGKCRKFKKNELVMTTIDNKPLLLLVTTGFVKRYSITNDGLKSIQSIYGIGDVFSLTPVFKVLFGQDLYSGPETFYYETMVDTELASIGMDELCRRAEEDDPLLYRNLLGVAGQRLQSNIQRLENIALRDASKRVAHQLLYYANCFGEKTGNGIRITVPLTHQDLGGVLSLTRETVSREISSLRSRGFIRDGRTQAIIIDKKKELEELAYS